MRRILIALLACATPLGAQTARDSAHAKVMRAKADTIAAAVDTIKRTYPNTLKSAPILKRQIDRIANNRIAASESTFVASPSVVVPPKDTAVVVVPPVTPPPVDPTQAPSIATAAELPRLVPNPVFGKAVRTVSVVAGTLTGDLQAALNASQLGDSLALAGVFPGNFVLPARQCGAGISITSAVALPLAGTRVTPTAAALFAKIVTNNSAPALKTTNPTCGWRIAGLEIAASASAGVPNASLNYGIVWLGDGGWAGGGETQTSLAAVPSNILIDRVYLHGAPTTNSTRCLALNSGTSVVRDSWISDCHATGNDSQAIEGWNGPGPYLIENNFLAGAGENVMFGGADPAIVGLAPSDITIRRNHIWKDPAWKGLWSVKNLVELKNARRVLYEANVIENTWPASQVGMAVVIKSSQDACGTCTWQGTQDVTFTWNVVRNAARALNLQANDATGQLPTNVHTARVTVEHNLFTGIGTSNGIVSSDGWLMLLVGDLKDVRVSRNTFASNTAGLGLALMMSAPGAARVDVSDNVLAGLSYYALSSDQGQLHASGLTWYAGASWSFQRNAVAQVNQEFWGANPSASWYRASVAELGLAADYSLGAASPFKGKGWGGTDPGADIAELARRTAGVVVAP